MKQLLKLLMPVLTVLSSASVADAQSVKTQSISFAIEDVSEMFMPPDLRMNIEFIDENGNNILEAEENGRIRLNIINKGGKADDVTVSVIPENTLSGITLQKNVYKTAVPKNNDVLVEVPMQAELNVPTGYTKLNITVSEPKGFDINAIVEISTFAYQKAKLNLNGVEITDSGVGLNPYNGNPDNKLQNLDVARASVMIQNIGQGQADDVNYVITSRDPNIKLLSAAGYVSEIRGVVPDMLVGQTEEITFRLSPNAHYRHKGGYIPVYLTVTEDKGFGNINDVQVPIPFDEAAIKPEVVKVDGNQEQLLAMLGTKVYSEDSRVNQSNDLRDIMVVPLGEAIHRDAIAVVIGSEKYSDRTIPPAPYAARDAKVMAEYFKKSLGIEDVRLMTDDQVSSMELKKVFDATRGSLSRSVVKGQTDIFIYYSGHGVPMENTEGRNDIFLIPYDVGRDWIREEGFSLNGMYSDLSSLGARSVTVILDACFSGGSRGSDVYESKSLANQKLAMTDFSEMEQPWIYNPEFRVFTSSRGDQASSSSDRSQSGLFTYWLAVGLQGEADTDADGLITLDELSEYVTANVMKASDGTQTPQLHGNGDLVLEKIR